MALAFAVQRVPQSTSLAPRATGHGPRATSLVLVLALALATGACSPARTAKPVTVEFWAMGREGEVVQQMVPEFERRNPGVRVRVQQIPWTAAHEKLLTAFVGDATPDVAQLGNTWIPELVELHALLDLTPRVAAGPVVTPEASFPGIWATNVIGDRVYGVPWYVDTRVLFLRTDLLARAGVNEPPRSWATWRDAMVRVTRLPGGERYGILLPTNEWAQPVLLGIQAGATLLRDGDRYGAFRAPEFRRAFAFYLSLFSDRLAPALNASQVANVYQQFGEGFFAMYVTGPWNLGEFRRRLPASLASSWTTAPLPAPEEAEWPGLSLAGGSSLVVFRSSRHPDAAWRLIEFLAEPEQQEKFFRASGDLPASREAWRSPALAGDPQAQAFFQQLQHVQPMPRIPEWEQIATRVFEAAEQAIQGRASIDDALAALDRDVDRMLEKRRWMLDRRRTEAR
jgi:multiple sugar transport system substrate-binding protein